LTTRGFAGDGGDDGWIAASVPCDPSALEAADEGGDGSLALRRRAIHDRLCVERRGRGWGQIAGSSPWMRGAGEGEEGSGRGPLGMRHRISSPACRRPTPPPRWPLRLGDGYSAPRRTNASASVPLAEEKPLCSVRADTGPLQLEADGLRLSTAR
jgi:hypothetical protein